MHDDMFQNKWNIWHKKVMNWKVIGDIIFKFRVLPVNFSLIFLSIMVRPQKLFVFWLRPHQSVLNFVSIFNTWHHPKILESKTSPTKCTLIFEGIIVKSPEFFAFWLMFFLYMWTSAYRLNFASLQGKGPPSAPG